MARKDLYMAQSRARSYLNRCPSRSARVQRLSASSGPNRDEFAELRAVFDQTKALRTLDGRPLFVLTADVGRQSGWSAAPRKLATLSTNSPSDNTWRNLGACELTCSQRFVMHLALDIGHLCLL